MASTAPWEARIATNMAEARRRLLTPQCLQQRFGKAVLERHLEAWRQLHSGGHAGHLFLAVRLDLAYRIVHRGSDQVFENVLVFLHQAVIKAYTLDVMTTIHHHADQT